MAGLFYTITSMMDWSLLFFTLALLPFSHSNPAKD